MKHYLLNAWNVVDPIYYHFTRLNYILDHNQEKTLFRVRLTRYKGRRIILNDKTVINKNDLLLKIHLHNVRLLSELHHINSDMRRAVYIYHMIKDALPRLAHYVESHERARDIKGIIGITTLHRGAIRLGFEVWPIKNKFYRTFKTSTFVLINKLANNPIHHQPVYLFMSKQQLKTKYAEKTMLNS